MRSTSAFMKEALDKGAELFGWNERKARSGQRNGSKVRGVGVAVSRQRVVGQQPAEDRELGELAVTGPCALAVGGGYRMFFVSDDGERTRLMLATSDDALDWNRRGATLTPSEDRAEASLDAPCVIRRHDGSLQLWYTLTGTAASGTLPCICAARFSSTSTS